MSNLLEQASLVLIPSGYEEDVVYSEIPLDGSGDMTLTRASNGTRVNSAGLVEVCPWNLCTYSEQFQNADWSGGGLGKPTMTDNFAEAPNGTMTASKMEAVSDQYQIRQNNAQENTQMNLSVWLRTNTGTKTIQLFLNNGNAASQNITVTTTWTRYEISGLVTTLSGSGRNGLVTLEALTSSNYILVWGFQLSIGLTAKPYFPTTDRLNVPRLTYQNGGGGCPSLLLEKQSTNEANYSQQFDDSYWYKNYQTVTANATTSPDGTQNADLLIPSAGTGDHYLLSQTVSNVSGQVVTLTLFVKKKENDYFYFGTGGASAFGAVVYQFSTNTFVVSGLSATATNFGNGWIRLSITGTTGATDLRFLFTPTDSTGSRTYNANGTDGTYIWGAQAEASSYPTSYIPTTSSSATRVADACFKTGISSLIGQTEGTLYWDGVAVQGNYNQLMFIKDSSVNQFIGMTVGTGVIYGEIYNGGYVHLYSYSIGANDTRFKMALAYKTNSFAFYVNGVQVASSTTGTTPTSFDDFYLGNTNNLRDLNCQVNEAVIFPTRLTNAELASLTTI